MVALANMRARAPVEEEQQGAPAPGGESAPSGEGQGDDGDSPNVTPEEQAQYEQFVHNGLSVIYSGDADGKPSARPDILHQLNQGDDPIGNLANTAVRIVTMLQTSAKKAGQPIDDAVLMHGGQALLEELATAAQVADIHDYSEKEMQGAWYRALDLWRDSGTQAGDLDTDALKQQFGEIQNADQQGQLDKLLPGISSVEKPEEEVR